MSDGTGIAARSFWEDIVTAPTDGTAFYAVIHGVDMKKYDNPGQAVCVFDSEGQCRVATGWVKCIATRWHPLMPDV
jgi:hypothetical protein